MHSENIQKAAELYPRLNDVVELSAHHDVGTPIYRLCEFVANFAADILVTKAEETTEANPYGDTTD